jgi:hypothetical protein
MMEQAGKIYDELSKIAYMEPELFGDAVYCTDNAWH